MDFLFDQFHIVFTNEEVDIVINLLQISVILNFKSLIGDKTNACLYSNGP